MLGLVGDKDREVYTLFDANGFLQESGEGYLFEKKFLKENINELIIDLKKGLFYEPNCNEIGLIITICDSMMGPSLNVSLPVEIIKSLLDKRMKEHGSVNIDAANSYNEASSLYFAASIG